MHRKRIIVLLFAVLIMGCSKHEQALFKEGKNVTYYDNGNISSEFTFQNGVFNGEVKEYYENGTLKYVGVYVNGLAERKHKYYYENQIMKFSKNFIKGVLIDELGNPLTGKFKIYYQDGTIDKIESYEEGYLEGGTFLYYTNGLLKGEDLYKRGQICCESKRYHKNGKLATLIVYNDDGSFNKSTYYDERGNIIKTKSDI